MLPNANQPKSTEELDYLHIRGPLVKQHCDTHNVRGLYGNFADTTNKTRIRDWRNYVWININYQALIILSMTHSF